MKYPNIILIILALAFAGCGASASSTDPVPIIAPVAGLISVSSPDAQGVSRVVGIAGAALPNAAVTVDNQNSSATEAVTAAADGSFVTEIETNVGNNLVLQQETGDGTSDDSDVKPVRANVPAVASNPVATATDPEQHIGYVASAVGSDSRIDILNLGDFYATDDFFLDNTLVISGFAVTDMDFEIGQKEFYMIDNAGDSAAVFNSGGTLQGAEMAVVNPLSVSADEDYLAAAIGQESSTVSVTIIDNSGLNPAVFDEYLITHPTNGALTHVRSPAVSTDSTLGAAQFRVAVLSEFSNGDTVFTLLNGATGAVLRQVNLGAGDFGRIVIFDDASQALVADTSNDRVIHFQSNGSPMDTRTNIAVGNAPVGVAADEIANAGFVTNSADNTVTLVDLEEEEPSVTLGDSDSIGLTPIAIAIDIEPVDDVFVALVANGDGQTATLVNILEELQQL